MNIETFNIRDFINGHESSITDERKEGMSMSIPYLANKQAIIIKKADKSGYDVTSLDAFKASAAGKIIYVESGSAAEDLMIIKK